MTEHKIVDRFEPIENPCDRCKWVDEVTDREFPCYYCIHNSNHIQYNR